jgi:hypothetical protein
MAEIYMSEHGAATAVEPRKQKNLTQVEMTQSITRKNRVALVVAPEWTPISPPYGIARMAAISQHSGFATRCWDVNILTMHEAGFKEFWTAYQDWKWTDPHYS